MTKFLFPLLVLLAPGCTTIIDVEEFFECDRLCRVDGAFHAVKVGKNPMTGKLCCECDNGQTIDLD